MTDERKSLVITGPTDVLVRYGAESGILRLDPSTGVPSRVLLTDCVGDVGSMKLEPDPVALAVQELRERFRKLLEAAETDAMKHHNYPSAARLRDLLSAIDAEPEPEAVSDFTRGGEAFREQTKERVYDWPCTDLCHDPAVKWLDSLPAVTEPEGVSEYDVACRTKVLCLDACQALLHKCTEEEPERQAGIAACIREIDGVPLPEPTDA